MMDLSEMSRLVSRVTETLMDDQDWDKVRTVAIVLELDSDTRGEFRVFSNDDRPWVQLAFLDEAVRTVEDRAATQRLLEDDD